MREDIATLTNRGNALQELRRYPEALDCYNEALALAADLPVTRNNRGNALRELQRLREALCDFDEALRLRPAFAEALNNRGNVLRDMGRLPEALRDFEAALALKPEFVMAHCNRGNTLLDLHRPREAYATFDALLQHLPDDAEALFGRASALLQLQESLERAAADFARCVELGMEPIEARVGRAAALANLQRHGEAAQCLSELLRLAPHRDYVRGSLAHSKLQTCDWSGLADLTREIAVGIGEGQRITHPLSLLSLLDDPEAQLRCARVQVEDKYPAAAARLPARRTERLRIAYVSADFRDHPVSHLLVGVLEQHDRSAFEVIGVSLQPCDNLRVRGALDRYIEVEGRDDAQVAQLMRDLEVDIAVDLMGFTQGLRFGIFAQRCAPVQVGYLGYAGTTGAPYMDYLLADEVVIPAGAEIHYSERIVRLPGCYLPNDDRREIGVRPAREHPGFVFCAFTSAYKIHPPVFDVWMRLLRETPGSILWLRSMGREAEGNLQREARARGVDARRLVFAPHVAGMAEHLARHSLADLYLDTSPYNAHSTACDALWAGVPVLTCMGRSFANRVAASALAAVGLPELITHSLAAYEAKALELARQPPLLNALRAKLADNVRRGAPLFATTRYCRHLEAAYRDMHERALTP